jgi:hypothetical protein
VTGYVVVLDANVLYGITVTDLFATMAVHRLFRPHWSPQILDEVRRNLAERHDLDPAAIDYRLGQLNRALPAALTAVPDSLIAAMPVNEKDKHVLALAVHVGAGSVVTDNLRDFPAELLEPFGIEAVSADAFARAQVELHPDGVLAAITAMAARRVREPRTTEQIIAALSRPLPLAMQALTEHIENTTGTP